MLFLPACMVQWRPEACKGNARTSLGQPAECALRFGASVVEQFVVAIYPGFCRCCPRAAEPLFARRGLEHWSLHGLPRPLLGETVGPFMSVRECWPRLVLVAPAYCISHGWLYVLDNSPDRLL
jgi:hypothetical protein